MKKRVVIVKWLDAIGKSRVTLKELIDFKPTSKETIGYLLVKNKDRVTLCSEYDTDGGDNENNEGTIIPRKMVVEIIELVSKDGKEI